MIPRPEETAPEVVIEQLSREAASRADLWVVAWTVRNLSAHPLRLLRGRLPHSLFYCPERELSPPRALAPGESGALEFAVAWRESEGPVIENAFLILQAAWRRQKWWVFARLRVVGSERGPHATTENVTIHPMGFSA